jgi:hypothetical protein
LKPILLTALVITLASGASAGDAEKGAKAIFVDSTSGAVISSAAASEAKGTPGTNARKRTVAPASASAAEVSGLMYYVELVSPKGETSRVTTDRVFHSGERILLHVVSSINGDVAVYQRAADGRAAKLFPDDRIDVSNAHITRGVDTILPSPTSWFRFDDRPGTEELTIVLTPQTTPATQRQLMAGLATPARYDDIALASGSKGLVLETDHAGPAQATYVVRRTEGSRPPESIVVAIRLDHR